MRVLGLDVGTRTIGLAVGDTPGGVATPLRTITRAGGRADLDAVSEVAIEVGAELLLLGLPLTPEGREGAAARRVRAFGRTLEQLELAIHYSDERYSTVAAERTLLEADLSRRRRKQVINHVAAALILQTYLDQRANAGSESPTPGSAE